MSNVPHVFTALAQVRDDINKLGVAKDTEAKGDGIRFLFRGIDAVLNGFSGPMVRAGLMIIPTYSCMEITQRTTGTGKANHHASIMGSYRAISTVDGSEFQMGDFFGEANDTQDKAIAKAQSIALRQAYLQTFVVPLGAEYDPEISIDPDGDGGIEADDTPQAPKLARNVEGEHIPKGAKVVGSEDQTLESGQLRVLTTKLRSKGLSVPLAEKQFGKPFTKRNINDVMDWVNKLPKAEKN